MRFRALGVPDSVSGTKWGAGFFMRPRFPEPSIAFSSAVMPDLLRPPDSRGFAGVCLCWFGSRLGGRDDLCGVSPLGSGLVVLREHEERSAGSL
ncbi:hypothetical protein A3843_00625 [Pseudovibrio exalbescens]|uniref:Uncharacterized protein n=1 Tax=Pseudovibrio exalbescens TaxID=197461 RepID=A0A1U7JCC2_9HYPH|nr:hypothetical protein A3843_00625 [Pseudovibrio exalbescens]